MLLAALKDGERQLREAAAIALGMCRRRAGRRRARRPARRQGPRRRWRPRSWGSACCAPRRRKKRSRRSSGTSRPRAPPRDRRAGARALGRGGRPEAALRRARHREIGQDRVVPHGRGRPLGGLRRSRRAGGPVRARRDPDPEGPRGPGQQAAEAAEHGRRGPREEPAIPDPRPFVLEMLQDTRFDVRAAAAIAAGRVLRAGDKAHVQALIKALAGEAHTLPTRFMIISLGRIGGPEAIAALSQQLASRGQDPAGVRRPSRSASPGRPASRTRCARDSRGRRKTE